jgi:hypothetical protein
MKITIAGKAIELPDNPAMLPFVKVYGISGCYTDLEAVLVLTELSEQDLARAKEVDDFNRLIDYIARFLKQIQSGRYFDQPKPKAILGCPLPSRVQHETVGQYWDSLSIMRQFYREGEPLTYFDVAVRVAAIYVQKQRDGEYDYDKAMKLCVQIQQLPFAEVAGFWSFFMKATPRHRLLSLSEVCLRKLRVMRANLTEALMPG